METRKDGSQGRECPRRACLSASLRDRSGRPGLDGEPPSVGPRDRRWGPTGRLTRHPAGPALQSRSPRGRRHQQRLPPPRPNHPPGPRPRRRLTTCLPRPRLGAPAARDESGRRRKPPESRQRRARPPGPERAEEAPAALTVVSIQAGEGGWPQAVPARSAPPEVALPGSHPHS